MSVTEALSASAKRRLSRRPKPEERGCYAQRRIVGSVAIEIAVPPSANRLFFNVPGAGRRKTPAYRAWRNNAVLMGSLPTGKPPRPPGRIAGPCRALITLPPGRADGDNLVKPCLDAAVEIGVIADDGPKFIVGHAVERDATRANVRIVFTMVAIDETTRAEVELRAREGQTLAYIAAAHGLTGGQVEAILAGVRP